MPPGGGRERWSFPSLCRCSRVDRNGTGCRLRQPRHRARRRRPRASDRRCNWRASPAAMRGRRLAAQRNAPSIALDHDVGARPLPAHQHSGGDCHEAKGAPPRLPEAKPKATCRDPHQGRTRIDGRIETAPGQDATHLPVASRRSMPSPITWSGAASRPRGIARRLSSAKGMISKLTSGKASGWRRRRNGTGDENGRWRTGPPPPWRSAW